MAEVLLTGTGCHADGGVPIEFNYCAGAGASAVEAIRSYNELSN